MEQIADFILKHYPISQTWDDGVVINWARWAAFHRFLLTARDAAGGIIGLAIVRPVNEMPERYDGDFDEKGDILFVDLAIAPTKPILQTIAFGILARFGQRKSVAFHSKGVLKRHDSALARKALLRLR